MKKTNKYEHLTQGERDRLEALLLNGHKQSQIAKILKVDKSTVSREIKRNRRKKRIRGGVKDGPYESSVADHKACLRRYYAKYQGQKINENGELQKYIIEGLKKFESPDEISGRMKKDQLPFYASKTAIYQWLRTGRGNYWCQYLYSRRYHRRKRKGIKSKKTLIPNRISILERPLGATNKTRYGHYEGDTVVSGKKTGSKVALSVIYERKARYVDIEKIPNLKPRSHNEAVKRMLKNKKALSVTQDNGVENTRHKELGVPVYFCDPYSSWQKGGVEQVIKMIRHFIPKSSDINDYSEKYVKMVAEILNNKPRKSLGYMTPYEVMIKRNLFIKNKNAEVALQG